LKAIDELAILEDMLENVSLTTCSLCKNDKVKVEFVFNSKMEGVKEEVYVAKVKTIYNEFMEENISVIKVWESKL